MNTTKPQHTPTPWSTNYWKCNETGMIRIESVTPAPLNSTQRVTTIVAKVPASDTSVLNEDKANAEFLVRAVNNYEQMLDALKVASGALQIAARNVPEVYYNGVSSKITDLQLSVERAIAQAEGK